MAKGKYQKWLEPESLILLEGWARDGLTDEQIAKKMGVNIATLYDWKKKYPEISESLKKGFTTSKSNLLKNERVKTEYIP